MALEQYDLPGGWVWTTIGEITLSVEKTDPTLSPNQEFTYLDISSIDNSQQEISQPKRYRGFDAPSRARQSVKTGDILFSTVRPYLKNIAVVTEKYDGQVASTGFCVLRANGTTLSKYLFYYTLTDPFLDKLVALQRGSSYPAVRDIDVRDQQIPLAPLDEQRRIIAEIETLFTRIDAGVQSLKRAQIRLKRYRASVLQAAVEGRLVPTEAKLAEAEGRTYEPASALLERVREQRRQQFIEDQRQTLQAQVDMIASANMSVTPMVLLKAWLQEMILLDADTAQPDLVYELRENFFATVRPELNHDEFRMQWAAWHKRAVVALQAKGITSQVLMNPRDVTVSRIQTSFSGMLGELNAQSRLQTDRLSELRQRWLIEPAEVKWREAEQRLAKPDVANLPELPEGWAYCTVAQIAEVRLGRQRSPQRAIGPNMRPYMRAANITWNGWDLTDVKEMDFTQSELQVYQLRKGDILLSEASGSMSEVGKPAIWNNQIANCCFQNTLIRVRPAIETTTQYLHLHFYFDASTQRFGKIAKGVGINHLGSENIAVWVIALPPLEEQSRIIEAVDKKFSEIDRAAITIEHSLRRADKLRQSVLRRAFAGELAPQDKSDEPASILLEHIRAERAAALSQPKLPRPKQVKDKQAVKAKERRPLYDVLKAAGKPMKPEDLFRQAGFDAEDVEAFYEELARETETRIDVVRPNKADVLIKLKVTKP